MSDQHANLPVKHGIIGQQKEIETTTMAVGCFDIFSLIMINCVPLPSQKASEYVWKYLSICNFVFFSYI